MTDDVARPRALLAAAPWLQGLSPALPGALAAEGRLARIAAGRWLQAEGDDETGLLLVVDGAVNLFSQAGGGREVLVGQIGAGQAIGQALSFGGGPRVMTAICAEDSLVLRVADAALHRVAAREPDLWRGLTALLYQQMRAAVRLTADALALPPRQRLASRLLVLDRARGQGGPVPVTQAELGELCGLTRKTANLHLRDFAARGLVRAGYGGVEVLDGAGLAAIVRDDA